MKIAGSIYNQKVITQKNKNNISFGAGRINILAMADNHGKLTTMPALFEAIKQNLHIIFPKAKKNSTLNIFTHVGDLFINPIKNGLITDRTKKIGDIQFQFFHNLIISIKDILPQNKPVKFFTAYTPGNHCFEGGAKWLFNKLKNGRFQTILTNVDLEKSKLYKELNEIERKKIVNSRVLSVPDDKDLNRHHKMLMLGLTNPGIHFYTPGMIRRLKVIDSCNKNELSLEEKELQETFTILRRTIQDFKKENPQGAVLLQSHIGNRVADMILDNVEDINVILNAHDHASSIRNRKGAKIISLGENNEFARAFRFDFNDSGNLSISRIKSVRPKTPKENNPISNLLQKLLGRDTVPILKIKDQHNGITEMGIQGIRHQHSLLANYVTDSISKQLKIYYPNLSAVGLLSSTFREGLKIGDSNLDLMKVLDGSIENMSELYFSKIKGSKLIEILDENVKANLKSPERNTIIQWSGIKINKHHVKQGHRNAYSIKDLDNGQFKPIDSNKIYQIALPKKYLKKYCPIKTSFKITSKSDLDDVTSFYPTGKTLDQLFKKHLKENNYLVTITDETREERIIS